MKFRFEKTSDREEVVAYGKTKTDLIMLIEKLCSQDELALVGYKDNEFTSLNVSDIECFYTQNDKVYAKTNEDTYLIKKRLYELDEMYQGIFTFINQGCLANLKKIHHFEASIGGSLLVVFKSGYKDYVSRRQIKIVKERIGVTNEK